jgi:predicted double-glycine peptidase
MNDPLRYAHLTLAIFAFALLPATPTMGDQARTVKSLLETRQTNVVVQQWDISCGAAALTTLLDYQHGESLTEKQVATGLMRRPEYIKNPNIVRIREGFSLLDLKRYVDTLNYTGVGLGQLKLKDLLNEAPIIVPVSIIGYNHFVIFRGLLGNRVLLADPAWGNRTMLVDKFESSWIDYPKLGHVGFVVRRRDGIKPPNRLAPKANEFLVLG